MKRLVICAMVSMFAVCHAVKAESIAVIDPGFREGGPCVEVFCLATGTAADPISGKTTFVTVFDPTYIPRVTTGDMLVKEKDGSIGDLVRFETFASPLSVTPLGGGAPTSYTGAIAFVFSEPGNPSLPADVGLPTPLVNNVTVWEPDAVPGGLTNPLTRFTATSGLPGFVGLPEPPNTSYCTITAAGCAPTYSMYASNDLPVPDGGVTLVLLGGVLVGVETLRRRFHV